MRSGSPNRTADQLSGETVDALAGEADVGLATRDALATFPPDEVVVAVRPHEQEGLVESSATETARQHSIEGVPVRYVKTPRKRRRLAWDLPACAQDSHGASSCERRRRA
jgi:hypothetical protein